MLAVCRTCLCEVKDSNYINLDSVDSSEIKKHLAACVPELELVFVRNAVLCTSCANKLHLLYDFKKQCLGIEKYIRRFMLERHINSVSLVEVFKYGNPNWQEPIEKPEFIVLGEVEYNGKENMTCEVNSDSNEVTSTSRGGSAVVCNTSGQINTHVQEDDDDDCIEVACFTPQQDVREKMNSPVRQGLEQVDDDCVEVACCVSEEISNESDSYDDCVEVVYRPNIPINNNGYGEPCLMPEESNHQAVQHNFQVPYHPGLSDGPRGPPSDYYLSRYDEDPNVKVYGCHLCDFRTAYRRSLLAHQKVHSDLRPYECKICQRRFKHRYNVRAHMWTHTNEKPILCHLCEYRTTRNDSLQSHLKSAHGDLSFRAWESIPPPNVQVYPQ